MEKDNGMGNLSTTVANICSVSGEMSRERLDRSQVKKAKPSERRTGKQGDGQAS